METKLAFSYGDSAGKNQITCPVTLGFGPEESNDLNDVRFTELRLDGTLEAWFEQLNLFSMWLISSSRGLRSAAPRPGVISVEPAGDPRPGVVLRIQAVLRHPADFQALALVVVEHLTFKDGRYL